MADLKNLKCFLPVVLALAISGTADAQIVNVVNDPQALYQLSLNKSLIYLTEKEHNRQVNSIAKQQKKIAEMTATMAIITEAYQLSTQNIKGFGAESKYYVEIGLNSLDIITRLPGVLKAIKNSKIEAKAMCVKELLGITTKTQQLVGDFVNIVNNAKIESPLKGGTAESKGDGYNFLDRYDRITVANRIYTDLLELRYKVELLEMMAKYATWSDLWRSIDIDGWANAMCMDNYIKTLAWQWKGIKN